MKVVRPVEITDARFVSSTLTEAEYSAWSSATTYAAGDTRIHEHYIYESLQGTNLNHEPTGETTDTWWLKIGPTNRWAMFDQEINTGSTGSSPITIVVAPGYINSVVLLDVEADSATVTMHDGATLVFTQTVSLVESSIASWTDYFFEPFLYATQKIIDGLPYYLNGQVTVTITKASGTARVGGVVFGNSFEIGDVLSGARSGITSYSRIETNAFGVTQMVRRLSAKRMSLNLKIDTVTFKRVHALLTELDSVPCVWVAEPNFTDKYAPLTIFGYARDFQIEVPGPFVSYCSLEIQGMI